MIFELFFVSIIASSAWSMRWSTFEVFSFKLSLLEKKRTITAIDYADCKLILFIDSADLMKGEPDAEIDFDERLINCLTERMFSILEWPQGRV